MLKGFKEFIMRGNVVDLAVAVVIGAAFGAVVTSVVEDLFTPLIAAIFGKPDFSELTFTINESQFYYGNFINAVISFLTIATAIYFFVVVPLNRIKGPPEVTTRNCPECTSEIPLAATRCPQCTAQIPSAAAPAGA
jgi:large conductance mechanosensitive channel